MSRVTAEMLERIVLEALEALPSTDGVSEVENDDERLAALVNRITSGSRSIDIRPLQDSDRGLALKVIRIPRAPQTFRRKREVQQPSGDGANSTRPFLAEARMKLLLAIATGRRWLDEIVSGKVTGVEAIAAREGPGEGSARMIPLLEALASLG